MPCLCVVIVTHFWGRRLINQLLSWLNGLMRTQSRWISFLNCRHLRQLSDKVSKADEVMRSSCSPPQLSSIKFNLIINFSSCSETISHFLRSCCGRRRELMSLMILSSRRTSFRVVIYSKHFLFGRIPVGLPCWLLLRVWEEYEQTAKLQAPTEYVPASIRNLFRTISWNTRTHSSPIA